ncbi:hypothetical protein RN001_004252 [Aquatica leii]|uniref:Engulfment and cell motility protein 1 n=1 Tax=Aquatica leii TaxID=1421715 RepID=A0AAN7SPG9_9COLE|nr:hypothetical protein RN001_004252 [Aquatica leii]
MEARVGIEIDDTNILFKINKQKSLVDNVRAICIENNLVSSEAYGLKFSYTLDHSNEGYYVTDDNFQNIQNGFTLKLVESLDSVIDRIFNTIDQNRLQNFKELLTSSTDPGFVKLLVKKNRETDIFEWLTSDSIHGTELSACLLILLHILKKQLVKEVPSGIIKNIIKLIKNSLHTSANQTQYALAVLCQILYLRGHEVNKQTIVTELEIKDIISFIEIQGQVNLQLNTMMLINAMVKSVKGDKRNYLVKDLNRSRNRECIFTNIIKNMKKDSAMAHELYAYQTYIMSLYSSSLNSYITTEDNPLLEELELSEDRMNRSSAYVDFDEICRNRSNSTGTIIEDIDNSRISFASIESEKSGDSKKNSNYVQDSQICALTYEALYHYKKYHFKNFCQSRLEENTYEPGIYYSSEKVTRLLANILHIGMEPTKQGRSYHPLVFNASLKLPFFLELFSRTMWLLSKTRREMRAWTFDDYMKIFLVLEKQIKMALDRKPLDYTSLTKELMTVTYEEIDKQWQNEKQEEWKKIYQTNPNVQTLKKLFSPDNEKLIYENRMKTLQDGGLFPKLPEKKGKQSQFFCRLSDNRRTILWGDWDDLNNELKDEEPRKCNIADIKYFVIAKACPHVKDQSVKDYSRAFSIILDQDLYINFLAADAKTANIWIDGFNLLLGNRYRSIDYNKELDTLLEMDCALHLLELQNVPLPNSKPLVPPLPTYIRSKPTIPPKSPKVKLRKPLMPVKMLKTNRENS